MRVEAFVVRRARDLDRVFLTTVESVHSLLYSCTLGPCGMLRVRRISC